MENSLDLLKIRDEIDAIDSQIIELYEKRMGACQDVARYKIANGKEVLDRNREAQKIEKVVEATKNPDNRLGVEELFTHIMSISRKMQYHMLMENGVDNPIPFEKVQRLPKLDGDVKVVYQGVPGAYSHQAMMQYFGEDVDHFHVPTFREAMEAIRDEKADYAVLPIENTTAGIVNDVYDLLVEFDNIIVDYTDVIVQHALLGLPNADMDQICVVYSHPQGLMQCSRFLDEHKQWQRIAQANTAGSAKKVLEEGNPRHAAIASTNAAKVYGLKVLQENINYNDKNTTRFIIVSKNKIFREDASRISICFALSNESGTLYNLLAHFTYNGLNMTKIESRPIPEKPFEYRFFVEFEGNLEDSGVRNAIKGIKCESNECKVIGNF